MPSSGSDVSVLLSVVQVQYGCVMAPHRRGPKVYAFDGGHTAHNPHRLPSAVWAASQGHWGAIEVSQRGAGMRTAGARGERDHAGQRGGPPGRSEWHSGFVDCCVRCSLGVGR